ncbi:MAG: DUF1080 domain-containing protein [Candidatus Hydrogenedentes bacterium]|nr:DUF1080 domain-containing protein [Candidatus Hydrogenedentota bacterium]
MTIAPVCNRKIWPAIACLTALLCAGVAPAGTSSLFDGKTFTGWEGNLAIFRIEEGAIVGGTLQAPIAHNDFLCTTKQYRNFELRLKAKITGEDVNAGIQFRSQRVPNDHEVSGYQADLGQHYWGALYDEARRNKILVAPDEATRKKAVRENDWNEYVIRCEGPRIQLWLNGVQTVDYTEADKSIPQEGIIGLQIHSGKPSEAWYKEIVIEELKAE